MSNSSNACYSHMPAMETSGRNGPLSPLTDLVKYGHQKNPVNDRLRMSGEGGFPADYIGLRAQPCFQGENAGDGA
jgi:hypothetical protein